MKIIKGFEGEDLKVSDFGEWVGKDYIDYKSEYETNQKIIKLLIQENQELKADYGTKAQVERDLLMEENQELKKQFETGEQQYNRLVEEKEELQEQLSSITFRLEKQKEILDRIKKVCESIPADWSICGIEVVSRIENILKEVE